LIEPSVLRAAKAGYTEIYSTADAFAALKADGSITVWGRVYSGGANEQRHMYLNKFWYNLYHQVRLYLHHLVHPTP
jgi:hypothetical protein